MSKETNELNFDDLSSEELQKMLQDKIAELNDSNARLNQAESKIVRVEARALKVYEEKQLLEYSPHYAMQAAEMKYNLELAKQFTESGAFPGHSPEQIYTIMKAGAEMGMKPIQSLNTLYIIKGKIEPYGKGMIAILTDKGYKLTYTNETKDKCTATATDQEGNAHTETVDSSDPIIQRSNAAKISMKNKLRFHAVRMILNFQLPHLISSTADLFENDALTASTDNNGNTLIGTSDQDILNLIQQAGSLEDVKAIEEDHKSVIARDITLASELGEAKKRFKDG